MKFFAYLLQDIEKLNLVEIEREPKEGEILVKVKSALTCGTDTKMYKRGHPRFPFPSLFGHEASGIIYEKGKNTGFLKEGDEVVFPISSPCLECEFCKRGLENLCIKLFEENVWGAFAEYILIPRRVAKNSTFLKPKNITFEEGALLDPLSSVVFSQSFIKDLNLKVLIIGAGPMGYLQAVYSKYRGYDVTVSDIKKEKIEIYKDLNFKTVLVEENWEKKVDKFDLIFECSGTLEGYKSGLKLLERGGKLCLFAGLPKNCSLKFDGSLLHYNQNLIYGSFHYDRKSVLEAYDLLSENKLNLKSIFSGYFSLKQLPQVMERVLRGDGLKFVINP